MKTIDEMTAEELIAGLMRGDRESLKLGYSAAAAVNVAAERKGLTSADALDLFRLQGYAEGFADGLLEDPAQCYPARRA